MSSQSPILVFGATGNVGSEIIRQLVSQSTPLSITAAVRDLNKARSSLPNQVKFVEVKIEDVESIKVAVKTSEAKKVFLLHVSGFGDGTEILAALKSSAVEHIVLLSTNFVGLLSSNNGIVKNITGIEDKIKAAGFTYTFLRAEAFASNALFWKYGIAHGIVKVAHPDAPVAVIAAEDMASVAVQALTSNDLNNKVVNIIGPEPLTLREQVSIVSQVLNKPIQLIEQSEDEYKQEHKANMPEPIIDAVNEYYVFREKNGGHKQPRVDQDVIGSVTFQQYIQKHKADFNIGSQ